MIEPVVLSVNILAILHTNARTVQSVTHLARKYTNAPAKLADVRAEAERIAITLLLLQSAIHRRAAVAAALENQWQLQTSLDNVLLSCLATFKLLDRDLVHLLVSPEQNVDWAVRSYVALDETIIEYYHSRLRANMHALNLLLSCLQLDTVGDPQGLLQDRVFADAAQETMSIRSNNADLEIPESIYEGPAVNYRGDELGFNNSLLNSASYRVSVAGAEAPAPAYQESSNDRPCVGIAPALPPLPNPQLIQQTPIQQTPIQQTPIPQAQHVVPNPNVVLSPPGPPSPGYSEQNLIDLSDHSPVAQTPASAHADEMGTLTFPPFLSSSNGSYSGSHQSYTTNQTFTTNPTFATNQPYTPDQTYSAEQSLALRPAVPSMSIPSDKIVVVEPEAEKIVVVPDEQPSRYSTTSSASIPRPSSIISNRNRTPSASGSDVLSPDTASSPGTERMPSPIDTMRPYMAFSLPAASTAIVPPSDDVLESILTRDMAGCLASTDVNVQLDWAEEALRHCRVCAEYETRAGRTQRARTVVPVAERSLRTSSTRLVEDLAAAGNARAVFLKARYLEADRAKRLELHQTARRLGYMRSHYYIGLGLMEEKNKAAVWHFETGADYGDSACSYALSKILLEGTTGWTKWPKDEAKGADLLKRAAADANKDCPEPLYHLATLLTAPPAKSSHLHFKLHHHRDSSTSSSSSSKDPFGRDTPAAFAHLQRAALLEHAPAALRLGLAHRAGELAGLAVARDAGLAMHYLQLAARRGLADADYEIANSVFWGAASSAAELSAAGGGGGEAGALGRAAWVHARRAAEDGVRDAYALVAMGYEKGIGVEKSDRMAVAWYARGASAGDKYAEKKLDSLRAALKRPMAAG